MHPRTSFLLIGQGSNTNNPPKATDQLLLLAAAWVSQENFLMLLEIMMLRIGAENLDSGWVQHRFCSLNHCQTIPVHGCLNEILNIVSRKLHMVFWSIWTWRIVVMVKIFYGRRNDNAILSNCLRLAVRTNTIAAVLYQVPNQPCGFSDDEWHPRSEDDIIACKQAVTVMCFSSCIDYAIYLSWDFPVICWFSSLKWCPL